MEEDDEYKISLSFEGDRHLTGWLLVMSKSIREAHETAVANAGRGKRTSRFDKDNKRGDEDPGVVPMLDIEITHGRGEIRAVKADTVAVGRKYLKTHRSLVEEFHNHTVWRSTCWSGTGGQRRQTWTPSLAVPCCSACAPRWASGASSARAPRTTDP